MLGLGLGSGLELGFGLGLGLGGDVLVETFSLLAANRVSPLAYVSMSPLAAMPMSPLAERRSPPRYLFLALVPSNWLPFMPHTPVPPHFPIDC